MDVAVIAGIIMIISVVVMLVMGVDRKSVV